MNGPEVVQWLKWADEDYLGSRSLLLQNFLLQGTVLANTAIEKYLKAALHARNVSFRNTHDVVLLYSSLKGSGTAPDLNEGFLRALGKAYKLRYPDNLPKGFTIVLAQVKVLTETDSTVFDLRKGFGFQRTDGRKVITLLDQLIETNSGMLIQDNVAFGSTKREHVFGVPTRCFELRKLDDGNIMEAQYYAGPIPDDRLFESEGMKPGTTPATLNLHYEPQQRSVQPPLDGPE